MLVCRLHYYFHLLRKVNIYKKHAILQLGIVVSPPILNLSSLYFEVHSNVSLGVCLRYGFCVAVINSPNL